MGHRQPTRWTAAGLFALAIAVVAPPALALDLDDLIRLKISGIGEDTILKLVEVEEAVFYLSVQDMIDLKDAGASDYLIREIMDTPARFGDQGVAAESPDGYDEVYDDDDVNIYVYDYEPYDTDDYTVIFSNFYYDPFAYHWYWWPRAYVYYSPFWWARTSFYYGGYWCRDWWDPWGSCVWYCDWHYGYGHHCGTSHTRVATHRSWNRGSGAAFARLDRERTLWRKAGTDRPPAVRSRTRTTDQAHRAYRASQSRTRTADAGYDGSRGITRSGGAVKGTRSIERDRASSAVPGARGSSAQRPQYRSRSDRGKERSAATRGSVDPASKPPARNDNRATPPRSGSKIKSEKAPPSTSPATGKDRDSRGATRSGGGKDAAKAPAKKEPSKSPSADRGRSGRR